MEMGIHQVLFYLISLYTFSMAYYPNKMKMIVMTRKPWDKKYTVVGGEFNYLKKTGNVSSTRRSNGKTNEIADTVKPLMRSLGYADCQDPEEQVPPPIDQKVYLYLNPKAKDFTLSGLIRYYKVFPGGVFNFMGAKYKCEDLNSSLVELTTKLERKVVVQMINESEIGKPLYFAGYWKVNKEFRAISGNKMLMTIWAVGQPNMRPKEDCGCLDFYGRLHDCLCNAKYPFICEHNYPPFVDFPKNGPYDWN